MSNAKLHREAGQAVFAHECEHKRHALTVSWGALYPALDERSMPQVLLPNGETKFCHCGGDYERVEACAGSRPHGLDESGNPDGKGDHDCHPIAGHVERSDDHTANLIETPQPDPDEAEIRDLQRQKWRIEQQQVVDNTKALLEADEFDSEWHRLDCRLTHLVAKRALAQDQALDSAGAVS